MTRKGVGTTLQTRCLRQLLLCCVLIMLPLGLQVVFGLDAGISFAYGEDSTDKNSAEKDSAEKRQYENVKTRKRQSVGKNCANKLEAVQAFLGSETEPTDEQLNGIAHQLNEFMSGGCKASYEKSQVYNLLGFVYYSLGDYTKATASYQSMVAEPDVDGRQKIDTFYTLAQLHLMLEDYHSAAQQLEDWMAASAVAGTLVSNEGKVLLSQVYYQLDRNTEALKLVSAAIDSVERKGELPREHWWLLQKALYYEKNGARSKKKGDLKVVSILKQLITHYPKDTYWHQLGGIYGQMEEDDHRLASLDILYLDDALTKSHDLMSLAYLYLGAGVPYRAAQIIEEGINQGAIESTGKNLETLGSAWQQARETKKALVALEQAAQLSNEGSIWSRLAMGYLDIDDNAKAVQAARKALRKGHLKYPSYTRMTLGNALVNLYCFQDAAEVFRDAAKSQKSQKAANQWVAYVSGEAARRDRLIESGASITSCKLP